MLTLNSEITTINRVGIATARLLKRLGIETVNDLLFYFPFRYDDFSRVIPIAKLQAGMSANVVGKIELIQNKRSHRRRLFITEALVSDTTDTLKVIWFNQPFIARNLKVGDKVSLAGKLEHDFGSMVMMSPVYEKLGMGKAVHTQGLVPNYHLTAKITQKQIRFIIKQIVNLADFLQDWLPVEVRQELKLMSLTQAITKIHFPRTNFDIVKARQRLAFNELFLIQLQSQLVKNDLKSRQATSVIFQPTETKKFVNSLPFKLTNAQRKAAWEILLDLGKVKPMSRLLEGDVGSGKTLVAVIVMLNVALNNHQAVLMVPTEILARQHFNTISKLLADFKVKIGLITRTEKRTNFDWGIIKHLKNKKLNSLFITQNCDIIIGTHALIQETIKFKKLALAIIDEQHRFGVNQRAALMTRTNTDQRGLTRTNADEDGLKQTYAEEDIKCKGLLYEELTYKIRGAVFEVKKQLGLGRKEKIYQNAMAEEFNKINISLEQEKAINVQYGNKKIGVYRPDFIIEDKVILEIKKLPFIGKFEKEQVWYYLKGSKYQLALLVNFGLDDVKIERFINTSPHQSASVRISPHLLSMTATPIPRSLALALYGDLDLSIIDQMPKGRKKIITKVVKEDEREQAYDFMREQIKLGRQGFVICPLIDPSDKLGVRSVQEEHKKLDKIVFPDLTIGMLHGRMKAREKEKIMKDFLDNEIKILVSTSVVEVGVDVANATIMMIEGADRFGLAQIHQFRGRVGRSEYQSYCFLLTDSQSERSLKRLEALVSHDDGFELAKIDLKYRGPGEIYGLEQKGFPELKIASLFDYQLMKQARDQAVKLILKDSSLNSWPKLKEKIGEWEKQVHLE